MPGRQILYKEMTIRRRWAPRPFQLLDAPRIEHIRRIVIVDGSHLQRESTLAVREHQRGHRIQLLRQGRARLTRIGRLIRKRQVAQQQSRWLLLRQLHGEREANRPVGTTEHHPIPLIDGSCPRIEAGSHQPPVARPVRENALFRREKRKAALGSQEEIALPVGYHRINLIGQQGRVFLVVMA